MSEGSGSNAPRYTNRLIHETSPYLRDHAHNPVDWYAWGDDAFSEAKKLNKPIHLSVGYHACHWCHVLAAESFEDAETAALMNELFVNIKVDREERPDIDQIYMGAVQALTGGGGWPMTVFLTPDGAPFFGGTYFPPEDRYNLPGFKRVLRSVADAYRERRGEVDRAAGQLLERLRGASLARPEGGELSFDVLNQAFERLDANFDEADGGFGGAPKFPQPMTLQFLVRYAQRVGEPKALHMLEYTLHKMALGGIYDQLGGGFHRYSVDARWLVPHFEKMLYDNAQLASLYLEAYQLTGRPLYRRVAEETLDYVLREMTHEQGGFFSSQDADSLPPAQALGGADVAAGHGHKEEGAFYVWTADEVRDVLGEDAQLFCQIYDVTRRGNFEGKSILNLPRSVDEVARVSGVGVERLEEVRARGRQALYAARAQRPWPARDEKVLTGWNGLMLRAMADAARVLGRDDYREAATRNGAFLLDNLACEGRVLRTWKAGEGGGRAKIQGYLEDYALLADGLLALYAATYAPRWLLAARELADGLLALFWSDEIGGFYDTAHDADVLITRPREVADNAVPAGTSVACEVLLKLARLLDLPEYDARARQVLASLAEPMAHYPTAFGRLLCAADWALAHVREVALVGPQTGADTAALLEVLNREFRPHIVSALLDPEASWAAELTATVPLLRERPLLAGRATAYVCEHFACKLPVNEPGALAEQLSE
jgi:uncharacterized protein